MKSSEMGAALKAFGISMQEAGRRITRGMFRYAMAIHSSHEVPTGPGEAMLICSQCRPVRSWPCENYEKTERALATQEAAWARQDSERVAS